MNVFVTGGAGYIGSICAEALLDAGHKVTVYDNLSEGHRSAVDPRARFVLGQPEEGNNLMQAVKEASPDAIRPSPATRWSANPCATQASTSTTTSATA